MAQRTQIQHESLPKWPPVYSDGSALVVTGRIETFRGRSIAHSVAFFCGFICPALLVVLGGEMTRGDQMRDASPPANTQPLQDDIEVDDTSEERELATTAEARLGRLISVVLFLLFIGGLIYEVVSRILRHLLSIPAEIRIARDIVLVSGHLSKQPFRRGSDLQLMFGVQENPEWKAKARAADSQCMKDVYLDAQELIVCLQFPDGNMNVAVFDFMSKDHAEDFAKACNVALELTAAETEGRCHE